MAEYIEDVTLGTSKLDWAFPFQRTGAFPLDRSSVFSSYEDAVLYASGGNDSRGLSGSSYVGQPISVYNAETATVSLYVINPDRTLKEAGAAPVGDSASIEIVDGKVQLKGFGTGYYAFVPAVKDEETGEITTPSTYEYTEGFKEGLEARVVNVAKEGEDPVYEIGWYEPSTETVDDISSKVETLATEVESLSGELDTVNGNVNGLTAAVATKAEKDDVYTKTETDALIAAIPHLKRKVVESVDSIVPTETNAEHYIYMVPTLDNNLNDKYDEYMVIDGAVEKLGSWEVDLSDYVTETALEDELKKYLTTEAFGAISVTYATKTELAEKVDKVENHSLVPDTEITKLTGIEAGAQKNYITSTTNSFTVTDGELSLNTLTIEDINGLTTILDTKVDKVYYDVENEDGSTERVAGTLLSPTDQKKLDALVIGDEGVEISGKVNADNVEGLSDWIVENRGTVSGLLSEELEGKLNSIEVGAQKNLFDQVNTDNFEIVTVAGDSGNATQLNLKQITSSQITDLTDLLNGKVDKTTFEDEVDRIDGEIATLTGGINGLTASLNNYVLKTDYEVDKQIIMEAITWQELEEDVAV